MSRSRIFSEDCDVEQELSEWASSPQGQRSLRRIVENGRARKRVRRKLATEDFKRQKKHVEK